MFTAHILEWSPIFNTNMLISTHEEGKEGFVYAYHLLSEQTLVGACQSRVTFIYWILGHFKICWDHS